MSQNKIGDHIASKLSASLLTMFESPAFENMMRLKGTSRDEASQWVTDPEEAGKELNAQNATMTRKQRKEFEFWTNVQKNGFEV